MTGRHYRSMDFRPVGPLALPRFKVMIETSNRVGGFGGWLTVNPALLVLVPTRPSRLFGYEELRQSTLIVTWIRQPLFPPWINRAIDFCPMRMSIWSACDPVSLRAENSERRWKMQGLQ